MKTFGVFLAVVLVVGSSAWGQGSTDRAVQAGSAEWIPLQHTVQEILMEGRLSARSARVAPGARIAVGDSVLDLAAVLDAGDEKLVVRGASKPPALIRQAMSRNGDAAFMLFGVERESETRYHTVVFMQDSTGAWAIESWHVSP